MADEKLEIDITAKDDASKVIDPLTKKVDQLEKSDPTIDVAADTGDAASDVESFATKLRKLSDSDQVVVLALRAGAAQSELTDLATQLAQLDASDPDIDVKLEHYAQVADELDQLETKMKDIADTSLDPDVGDKARSRLQGIGEEAGKTQGAVHSMAGNALGDFAATTSGIGPLGEAIGQLTETALEGEAGMKGLATAGLGIGALSGGMFLVNKAMGEFSKQAARAAEIKAFRTDDVDAFTKALTSGKDAADDYVERMTALGKVTTLATSAMFGLGKADIAPQLAEAGITMTQFADAVTGSQADLDRFDAAVRATGISVAAQNLIISGAQTEFDNYAQAQRNAEQFNKVFAASVDATGKAVDGMSTGVSESKTTLDKLSGSLGTATDRSDNFADGLDRATDSTHALDRAYQRLSDQLDADQALINLAGQLDDVAQAGVDAITAQADADKARAAHAKDAADKAQAAEDAMRAYQSAVISTKEDIISIAQTARVNPIELKSTLDKVDQGDLEGAKADAEAWSRRNPVNISVAIKGLTAGIHGAVSSAISGGIQSAGTTINMTVPRGMSGRELTSTLNRYARTGR